MPCATRRRRRGPPRDRGARGRRGGRNSDRGSSRSRAQGRGRPGRGRIRRGVRGAGPRARSPATSETTSGPNRDTENVVAGSPLMWFRTIAAPVRATRSRSPSGGSSPVTRLTTSAPASRTRRATSTRRVSTEIGIAALAARIPSTTGRTRESSSSAVTSPAPSPYAAPRGLVDSPPTSRIAAPAPAKRSPASTAARGVPRRPPSEKESGVTFRIAITPPAGPKSIRRPAESGIGRNVIGRRLRAWSLAGASRLQESCGASFSSRARASRKSAAFPFGDAAARNFS